MNKIKAFLSKYKKQIKQLIIILIVCIILSLLAFLILYLTNVITFNDGFKFNETLFKNLTNNWYGYLIFYVLQVVLTIVLCFAPGGTTTFIALAVVLFGTSYKTFLLLYAGVITSSLLMDLLGRFGGVPLIKKMFGEEDYSKAEKILKEKGVVYLPCMYLFPLFPDDLLCCIAGISKINFWYHLLIICLCRGIGVATIVFGLELIPYQDFTSIYEFIECILIILIGIYYILKIARYLDKKLSKYLKNKENHIKDVNKKEYFSIYKGENKSIYIGSSIVLSIFYIFYILLIVHFNLTLKFIIPWNYIVFIFVFFTLFYFTYRLVKFITNKVISYKSTKTLSFSGLDFKDNRLKLIMFILVLLLALVTNILVIYFYIIFNNIDMFSIFKLIIYLLITTFFYLVFYNYINNLINKKKNKDLQNSLVN